VDIYSVWIKERGSRVWHGLTPGAGYRTRCGRTFTALAANDVWRVRTAAELGPPEFDRCQWCQAAGTARA
jgi:hypothetical protein